MGKQSENLILEFQNVKHEIYIRKCEKCNPHSMNATRVLTELNPHATVVRESSKVVQYKLTTVPALCTGQEGFIALHVVL